MIFTELFENKTSALTEGVRVVDQDYDLDQIILTMDINGRSVSFTYTDYDEDFDNAERGDVHDQLQRNDWYAALSHPDRMEILDAAYRAIRGEEPGEYRPTVDDEPMDVVDRLGEQGVAEGSDDIEDTRQWRDAIALAKSQKAIRQARYGKDQKFYADGTPVTPEEVARRAAERKAKKKGVAEVMKPSDIPPSMRDRLTMRDIEAERPQGAFRFRVKFPDGSHTDFMDFEAARASARIEQGRISRLNETQPAAAKTSRRGSARIDRILHMLRARHPQAQNDLEALILDFRGQQAQDRSDISRLDAENDAEEADIERLEQLLQQLKQRRGTAPVAEAAPNEATRFYQQQYQQEMQRHGSARLAKELANRATAQRFGANWNIVISQPGQPDRYATPADAEMLDRQRREIRDIMTREDVAEGLRDGEFHIATVTLDDGSKKKVRITSDEGFRDQIERHFAKQGHTVKDIDVDYAVRSDLDEAKKKPQPTNPELWSRAKSAARSKFDVYPSAYANAWAAKWYKSKGGGWRMGKPKKD